MATHNSQLAAELLRKAAAASDTLLLDLPDQPVTLPEPLVVRAREIRLRGTGPHSALILTSAAGSGAPLIVQPAPRAAIGRFTLENLTLRLELADDAGSWSCLRVLSADDDQGVASGEIVACRFEFAAPRPLRSATLTMCQIGSDDARRAVELPVRMITLRDSVFSPVAGVALAFIHAHGCRAERNIFLDSGPARAAVESVAVLLRGAQYCEIRDNALHRDGGDHVFTAVRIAGTQPAPAVNNVLRDNLIESTAPANAFDLREFAHQNVFERNRAAARGGNVAVRLAPALGPVRDNWLFDNRITGFATAVRVEPGDSRGNRLLNSAHGAVDDASPGHNVIVTRAP